MNNDRIKRTKLVSRFGVFLIGLAIGYSLVAITLLILAIL